MYFNSQLKLPFNFWTYTEELTKHEKLLLSYLYTSPFTNRLGCFRFDVSTLKDTLDCRKQIIYRDLFFLEGDGYIKCHEQDWIFLPYYLVYFPIYNPNQGKHIEGLFYNVPDYCHFYPDLVHRLLQVNHLSNSFRKYLKHILYRFAQKQIVKEIK